MTREEREEALAIMNVIIHMIEKQYDNDRVEKAVDTAIAALKAEPCEDSISRKKAIEAAKYIWESNSEMKSLITIKMLKELPPVTPKQRWIPVDYDSYPETYPKAFQEVWVTDAYGEVIHKTYDGTRSIKAWMPYIIPKPYKEGESE